MLGENTMGGLTMTMGSADSRTGVATSAYKIWEIWPHGSHLTSHLHQCSEWCNLPHLHPFQSFLIMWHPGSWVRTAGSQLGWQPSSDMVINPEQSYNLG